MEITNIPVRIEQRNKDFESQDISNILKTRQDYNINLRKHRRRAQNFQRRSIYDDLNEKLLYDDPGQWTLRKVSDSLAEAQPSLIDSEVSNMEKLFILQNLLRQSENNLYKLHSLQALRISISTQSPAIYIFTRYGLSDDIIQHIDNKYNPEIISEACWALCNLASGNDQCTQSLIESNCISRVISVLNQNNDRILQHGIWALSNIAGDSQNNSVLLINNGILNVLENVIDRGVTQQALLVIAWLSHNLTHGMNRIEDLSHCIKLAQLILRIMKISQTHNVLIECIWGLSQIAEISTKHIEIIFNLQIISHLVIYLQQDDYELLLCTLRLFGNISLGNHEQTQVILNLKLLDTLLILADHHVIVIKKLVYWICSNISAGTAGQALTLLNHRIFSKVIQAMLDPSQEIKREVSWVLYNTSERVQDSILQIVTPKLIQDINSLLKENDLELLTNTLKFSRQLLVAGRVEADEQGRLENQILRLFEEAQCLQTIEGLLTHKNQSIFSIITEILDEFCEKEISCNNFQFQDYSPSTFELA